MVRNSLQLRCLIEQDQGLYVGYCLDLGLGVQGDTVIEVRERLHTAINGYLQRVADIARAGDEADALRLLKRKAPWSLQLRYWLGWLLTHWLRMQRSGERLF